MNINLKTNLKKCIFAAMVLTSTSHTFAITNLTQSNKDSRIKFVEYDAQNIVKLYVTKGIATQIEFEANEKILKAVYGESTSWIKSFEDNYFFIKPTEHAKYSNLFIQTNKRNYKFDLEACHTNCKGKEIYSLIFKYGKNKTAAEKFIENTIDEKTKIKTMLKEGKAENRTTYKNYQYISKGNEEILPTSVYDNGKYTYFTFAKNKPIPNIYAVIDNEETLTNSNVEQEYTIVVQQVNKDYVLRSGKKVLLIRNQNYNNIADNNLTNTISPFIQRIVDEK
jgi:type IV secretion system protein VirB9